MVRRSVPTSVTIALTVLGTVLGMKISTMLPKNPVLSPAANPAPQFKAENQSNDETSAYYPVVLVGEDGSRTPIKGTNLEIDLGGERHLDIRLNRNKRGHLDMWSPIHRDDTYGCLVVLHPHCANSLGLDLERIRLKDSADTFRYASQTEQN